MLSLLPASALSLAWPDRFFSAGRYRLQCKRPHEKRVWSGLSGRVVLDTSILSGGVDYIDITFKRQALSTFRRSYDVPVFFVSFTSELFVEPEKVKEIAWK